METGDCRRKKWKEMTDSIKNMPQEEFDKLVEECDKEVWAWDLVFRKNKKSEDRGEIEWERK